MRTRHGVLEDYALHLFEYEDIRDDDEEKVIKPFDIDVRSHNFTLMEYKKFWDKNYVDIPEFQRPYIWDKKAASKFIESVLLGLPVPNVFLYRNKKYGRDLIIDGHQRIVTIVSFMEGKFVTGKNMNKKFALSNEVGIWANKTYNGLDKETKEKFNNYIMRATVIRQNDPNDDTCMFQIFSRLNTGGKPLSPMEVRMCLGFGKFTKMLEALNDLIKWRKSLRKVGKLDQRRKDIELMLRFFALQEAYDKKSKKISYNPPMGKFLDEYVLQYQHKDSKWVKKKEKLFKETLDKALQIKENPFHYANPQKDNKERLNLTVFDSVMVGLAGSNLEGKKLKTAYEKLFKDKNYLEIIQKGEGTMSQDAVSKRIKIAKKVFGNAS